MRIEKPVDQKCIVTLRFLKRSEWYKKLTGREDHLGIDFAPPDYMASMDWLVQATCKEIVIATGYAKDAGNYVITCHNTGQNIVLLYYLHLKRIKVCIGRHLLPGTIIGIMGESGKVTGKHLHFGTAFLRLYTLEFFDPAPYFIG